MKLAGQWIGTIAGEFGGLAVLDLDVEHGMYRGSAFMFVDASLRSRVPDTEARINVPFDNINSFRASIHPLDGFGNILPDEALRERFQRSSTVPLQMCKLKT